MAYATPTLDGSPIFGRAVRMQVMQRPSVHALAEFFGVNGVYSTYGGKRGRLIAVQGVLVGSSIEDINASEGLFETYDDGLGHTLADTRGREWNNVLYQGDFQADPMGPRPLVGAYNLDGSNWIALPYKAAFLAQT